MTAGPTDLAARASDLESLAGAARLFGDLLLVELDSARLRALQEDAVAEHLDTLGVKVPRGVSGGDLDELAAAYHAAFLRPTAGGAPPIGSLWTEGRYEGDLAARIRELAESAAVEFTPESARGAPVDHLGSILHLWAETQARAPWVADEIAERHLGWADACLERTVSGDHGFYANVASATKRLVAVIRATRIQP